MYRVCASLEIKIENESQKHLKCIVNRYCNMLTLTRYIWNLPTYGTHQKQEYYIIQHDVL